jgi:LuxR family maltose regulon positive regulatory protein
MFSVDAWDPLRKGEMLVLVRVSLAQQKSAQAIELIVSSNTVKTQISSIYRKMGVSRRAEAIAMASRLHLL